MRLLILATFFLTLLMTTGCQEDTPQTVKIPPQSAQYSGGEAQAVVSVADQEAVVSVADQETANAEESDRNEVLVQPEAPERETPKPPVFEDFQGTPQLTLFPRVGDFRPEEGSDRLPYWNTFIDHLVKVTGVAEDQVTGNRGWVFRSINSIDSVGYFSPFGVKPQTTYKVSFTLAAELVEDASAGIGILEFNEFLWIPGQYTEETFKLHFRGSREGKRLTGIIKGEHAFTFTTGPDTRMIHVVLFREGAHDRNNVMFDDIKIEEIKK